MSTEWSAANAPHIICAISCGAYNSLMAKKITLEDIARLMEKGFAAVATDIAAIRNEMATKEQLFGLQTQVSAIEAQLRETRIEIRLSDLEEKFFGAPGR